MLSSKLTVVLSTFFLASRVAGHGLVLGVVANGVWYQGYSPSFQYQKPPPTVIGWSIPEDQDTGFVSDYTNPDIICHKGATPGGTHATVPAGGSVELQWTKWPHPGPVIDYLANCNGDCEKVDKNTLKFFKISEAGMISGNPLPAKWASDTLIANNNSWTVAIPKDIAPGNYVLRHEIIALHQSENINGAQNYPQCVNIQVTGGGSANPSGVPGTELYHATDPGILVNIYKTTDTYAIPGPSLYSGAIQISQTMPAAPTASATGPVGGSSAAGSSSSNVSPTLSAAASSVVSSSGSVSSISTTAAALYTLPTGAASPSPTMPTTPTSPQAAYSSPASSLGNSIPSATCCPTATTPDMPLPSGMTLRQLLGWVELAIKRVLDGASLDQPVNQKRRRHARDLDASILGKRDQCVPCPSGAAASGAATDATSAQTASSPSSAASSGYTTLSTTASTASAASASSTAKDTASAYAAAFNASPSESSILSTKTKHSHHSPVVSPIADATDATPGVATPSGHHHHAYHCESPGASPIEGPDGTPTPTPTPHAKKECSAMPYGTGSYTYKPKHTSSGTPVADGASIGAPTPTAMSGEAYGKRWVQ